MDNGESNVDRNTKLKSGVRMKIYSYMTMTELMEKICKVSKNERAMLIKKQLQEKYLK